MPRTRRLATKAPTITQRFGAELERRTRRLDILIPAALENPLRDDEVWGNARAAASAGIALLAHWNMMNRRQYHELCETDWRYDKEQLDERRAAEAAEANTVRPRSNEYTRAGFDFDFPAEDEVRVL